MDAESLQTAAYEETIRILTEQISRRTALITELCEALEWWENHTSYEPPFAVELKKRAREATR